MVINEVRCKRCNKVCWQGEGGKASNMLIICKECQEELEDQEYLDYCSSIRIKEDRDRREFPVELTDEFSEEGML